MYSGKAHRYRGKVHAVARPEGLSLWVSPAEPGSVRDITALYRAAALGTPALAGGGCEGAGKGNCGPGEESPDGRADIGTAPAMPCCGQPGAPASGHAPCSPRRWRTFRHITASPGKIILIAGAAFVLVRFERGYLK
ncbi:MAG TPA: hypothetical protein VGM14_11325 [Streptosporangiaceae bacterium]